MEAFDDTLFHSQAVGDPLHNVGLIATFAMLEDDGSQADHLLRALTGWPLLPQVLAHSSQARRARLAVLQALTAARAEGSPAEFLGTFIKADLDDGASSPQAGVLLCRYLIATAAPE
jgi:hypothetical protein